MDWMFDEVEKKAAEDIYLARSWLLVTKCIFPRNFRVLFEAYKLEKSEMNASQCASLIVEMFRSFPDEYLLNKELELMVIPPPGDKDSQQFLSSIFDSLQPDMQQNILMYTAGRQIDINSQCKLTLTAMRKIPRDTMKYGIPLTEKLLECEKIEAPSTALNKYRKLLVCDVIPVICECTAVELSHKQYYKWLQKAIEFFVAVHTSPRKLLTEAIGKSSINWTDLEALRAKIGMQCGWEPYSEKNLPLVDRMKFIKDMHRLSRTDVSGNINKRQIFYTSLLLLLESSIEFSKLLDPAFCDSVPGNASHIIYLQPFNNNEPGSTPVSLSSLKESLHDCFQVARTSWSILQTNESFSKDFNHLVKRWKMERWAWFQLLMSLRDIFEKDYKACVLRLNRLLEQNRIDHYPHVNIRCLTILATVYYTTNQKALSCRCIIECLTKLKSNQLLQNMHHSRIDSIVFSDTSDVNPMILMPLNQSNLLPSWIFIFVTSLMENVQSSACTDETLGHILVLSQHGWPQWKEVCGNILDIVLRKTAFSYPIFFDYIVVGDILEEISLLWNSNEKKTITLHRGTFASQQRVTRGVNKGTEEEFNNMITTQMNKGESGLEDLLVEFILKQESSLMDCLLAADGASPMEI